MGLAVFASCKEVILLSKTLYNLIKSAKNAVTESHDLHAEIYHEIVFLQSFGRLCLSRAETRDSLGEVCPRVALWVRF